MTKLIVTPIDMSAPGSYRERQRLLRLYADLQGLQGTGDIRLYADAMDAIEAVVMRHAETDDGTTVSEALEMASAADFDRLIFGLVGGETVPNASSAS